MCPLRLRVHPFEYPAADDVDPSVFPVRKTQDFNAPDNRVPHDEMKPAPDQLIGPLGLEPRREMDLTLLGTRRDPLRKCRKIGAADGHSSHVELRHDGKI